MTKKEKLELINEVTLAVMEALSKNGMNTNAKRPTRTKILPDDTATAIGDIIAEAVSEQEKTGKMPVVQKDTAIIMEYSEKMYAIWGDTKTRKEIIKKFAGNTAKWGIIWGYKPKGVTEENKAQGWFIPKSKLDGNGGMKDWVRRQFLAVPGRFPYGRLCQSVDLAVCHIQITHS